MPNRLAGEISPYLLQHQNNPVDWYPWGPEAWQRARAEDKPIFLSIGYSACHWCHVMERESFSDPEIAELLNRWFVCIKVDREERPDLDQLYMNAVQLMTQQGGWPMSVFLTPELRPFYGGTYWPPRPRMGMPGFSQIVQAIADAWSQRREAAEDMAARLTAALQPEAEPGARGQLSRERLDGTVVKLRQAYDFAHGGFGHRPKFPQPMLIRFLLRVGQRPASEEARTMACRSLDRMAGGGIYDHLGGGFARYSVDENWQVPHFEKMLYDNALLANAYLDGYLATGDSSYARVVRETLDYVRRDMTDPAGGFHSTEDADSEGVEGKFYVWTPGEIHRILGEARGTRFCELYNVTEQGNFEQGTSILNRPRPLARVAADRGEDPAVWETEMAAARQQLLAARQLRVRPHKDDKILVSWNSLMIQAMARAATVLNMPEYGQAATRAARFLLDELRRPDGRLMHCWRQGHARFNAYLDDYAYLIQALVHLYELDFDESWVETAVELADLVLQHFTDPETGSFFFTADDHEPLIARTRDWTDSSVPSGNAMAATCLWSLGTLCGREDYLTAAGNVLQQGAPLIEQAPLAVGQLLLAADLACGPLRQILIVGDPGREPTATALRNLRQRFLPHAIVACRSPAAPVRGTALDAAFAGKTALAEPTVYVCEDATCHAPVAGYEAVLQLWDQLA